MHGINENEIQKLMDKYNSVRSDNKEKTYNEEATKDGFIKLLFAALGWDFSNLDEVSPEDKVSKKRVDYALKIDSIPKFFLEAKSLDEDLDGYRTINGKKITYVEQAVNYAYYRGCNWAVLTNFKEIRVYDAWSKTNPLNSFRFALRVDSFLSDFEDGLYLLSKEAFKKELLDKKYGTKARKKPISEQLLNDFTIFRVILSKDVYGLNKKQNLTEEDLDEAIQRIFDRLIFIRNCEDREYEPPTLLSTIRQWEDDQKDSLMDKIRDIFVYYNDNYDSKIFGEHKGDKHLCDQIEISNDVLDRVINGLYTTADGIIQYDFSLIDADVLGNIYEQYLSHILKKTEKRTKLTESKAKRKEEGIYYTPSHIVDYIVRNTLGNLIKDKNTKPSEIKIVDPACGSGSFLIKAFDILNSYYSNREGYDQRKLDLSGDGTTYSTKLSILKNSIFGVDLDKQAVDIAQLNLLLKVAEKKKRLPILQENIKNGNSIIDNSDIARDKAFRWNEFFKEIIEDGGFGIVIGNPPYIRMEKIPRPEREYYKKNYEFIPGRFDTYSLFLERGLKLLKKGGYLGFIVPNTFINNDDFWAIRKFLLEKYNLKSITFLGYGVFQDATVSTIILIIQLPKNPSEPRTNITTINYDIKNKKQIKIKQISFLNNDKFRLNTQQDDTTDVIKKCQQNSVALEEEIEYVSGIQVWQNETDREKHPELLIKKQMNKDYKRTIIGKNIDKYYLKFDSDYVLYDKKLLERSREERFFEIDEKILMRYIGTKIICAYDNEKFYAQKSVIVLFPKKTSRIKIKYLLAILNSKLFQFLYDKKVGENPYPRINLSYILGLPIKSTSSEEQAKITQLVDKLISLKIKFNEIKEKKTDMFNEINIEVLKINKQINDDIYRIYGLTKEEQRLVESSIKD